MSIDLGISILSAVTFKRLDVGSYRNEWNTLHKDLKYGNYMIKEYCQKFNNNDVIGIQVYSSDSTPPVLKSFCGVSEIETIALNKSTTITGSAGTITYFTYLVTLDAAYKDKEVSFECTQDTDKLTSEPIYTTDLSDKLNNGRIKRIDCSNYLRGEAGLKGYWILWDDMPDNALFFYVDGQTRDINTSTEIEKLESSQSDVLVSTKLKAGVKLSLDGLPRYMCIKLNAASLVDFFAINEIEYVRDGDADFENFGGSTLYNGEISFTEKNTLGLNVISLGFETTTEDNIMIQNVIKTDQTADFEVTNIEGYSIHTIFVRHSATSSGSDATISAGSTVGGQEYISEYVGSITGTASHNFPIHDLPQNGDKIYFGVSGIGVKLDITIQYIYAG